jgi:asparagine synthase (glutamine-hydrolysing)
MCGIIACFAKNISKSIQNNLSQSLKSLNHRGPDDASLWVSDDQSIAMGHSRLAIVGISNGVQPIHNGDISIVVNGEFYDYQTIKADLEEKGHSFTRTTDSEILIGLYREYGEKMMAYLNGEFAFVLYDRKKNILLTARDRFGVKPLFYTMHDNQLLVASEIKALLKLGVPAEWNPQAIWSADNFIPSSRDTYFRGIHAVEPGHIYIIKANLQIEKKPYWNINYDPYKGSFDDATAELRWLLSDAVKRRLVADVPVTTYLSGGLDSSIILALVHELTPQMKETFSISFPNTEYDESHYAKLMANHLGIHMNTVEVNLSGIADNFKSTVLATESLLYNCQSVAKYILSGLVQSKGYKVVMTGEGADELFAGYPFFREDVFRLSNLKRSEQINDLHRSNENVAHAFLPTEEHNDVLNVVIPFLGYIPTMWRVGAGYGKRMLDIYSDNFKEGLKDNNPFEMLLNSLDLSFIKDTSQLNRSQFLWKKTNFSEVILSILGDRVEMANSIEARLPFLDISCIEFASSLPDGFKIKDVEKRVVKEACRDLLVDEIYNREKHPFTAPPAIPAVDEADNRLNQLYSDLIHSSQLDNLGFIDTKRFRALYNRLRNSEASVRRTYDPIINRICSAVILQQEYKMNN